MMEHIDRPFCPDPQVLGAFVEGTLAVSEVTGVRDHLAACNDCLDDVGEAAAQLRSAPVAFPRPRQQAWWLAAAAGVAVAVIGGGLWYRQSTHDPVDDLRSVELRNRYVEPRLTGFPHKYYENLRDASPEPPSSPEIRSLDKTIWELRGEYEEPKSVKENHAVGLTYLIAPRGDPARDTSKAAEHLRAAADAAPNDPKILNDYAAALYMTNQNDEALRYVDRALAIKPDFPEALFNRALILYRMDRREKEAATAWERYFQVDPNSDWAKDAKENYPSP